MCEQCVNFQIQIDRYSPHLDRFDPLTNERMKAAIAELEKRKADLHESDWPFVPPTFT